MPILYSYKNCFLNRNTLNSAQIYHIAATGSNVIFSAKTIGGSLGLLIAGNINAYITIIKSTLTASWAADTAIVTEFGDQNIESVRVRKDADDANKMYVSITCKSAAPTMDILPVGYQVTSVSLTN